MSKAFWFRIALLLYFALAAEALTCIKCKNFLKVTSRCVSVNTSKTCIAKLDQPCHIIKYFEGEEMKSVFLQGCLDPDMPCNITGSLKKGTMYESICCDNHDLCNTP